jgi:signal transduction histidine kinase
MFNRLSLRSRLLISYLLLLGITLSVILFALLVFLRTRPAPPQQTYQELAYLMQTLNPVQQLAGTLTTPRGGRFTELTNRLSDFASEQSVRALIVNMTDQRVLFDSDGDLATITLREEPFSIPRLQGRMQEQMRMIFGSFQDGETWLFSGLVFPRLQDSAIILSEPQPSTTVQNTLSTYGSALFMPLCQSALIGLGIAIVLAGLTSRNIARSLQRLARGAAAVAEGQFDQRIPEQGPPEVRAVAEAFNHMSTQVQETQQSQQEFLANVSHDLKTPLTSIQGYSQAIMDGAAKDPVEAAEIIYDEAGRLNRMVVELTDLARLEAGRLSMQMTGVDIGQIAAAVGQRLAVVAHKKGVALKMEASAMPEIAGDGDRLAQVLTNLVSNAIKYTPTGGAVQVRTQVDNGGVEVVVRDTGIGSPAEDLPHIFERFYQVDRARGPQRGTGLGLAITQEIVHAHGGKISVSSAGKGQGSTFTVWLPSPHLSTVVRGRR